jgi:formylglycine-generating enzyme required for sulfatase activity/low affinity Fe/Cu permease
MFRWGAHWQNVAISGIALVVVIYTVFVFTKIVNHFIPKVKTASFSFKPAGMEAGIEIDPKNMDESILNKYLDEILYFFERTDYNVVVIEDMDRLDTIKIFTKLRELNSLINEYEKIKHKVVFIYDVCDDLFKDEEERTKFFDFIIPVMPVVSRYNAKRELSKILVNWDLPKKDHEILITELSSCIDGMRLLRNTVNEYTIYHALNEKEGTNANQGKLFALMLYKNSYPGDFEQLRRDPEKAVIYKAMDKYRSIVGDDKESTEMSEAEIIDEIDKDVVKNKKQTTLLVALLNNHYMDEDYSFYIERGHPSKSDMAFFEAVSHNTSPDDRFEHPLNNIKVLLEMLREAKVNFEQECILNYQLVDYLLLPANADKTEYHIVREAIFRCMSNKSENSNEFVNEFIFRNESDIEQFVKEIRSYWTDILTSDRITLINKIKLLALVGTLEQQQAFRERLREQGRAFDKPTMIDVTGGTFRMGGTEEQGDDCDNDERPVHEVTLSSFKIGKYPVTQKQWTRIMGNNPSHNAQGGDYPVESVSWYEVQEFRKRLNVATGGNYRLPTEAEWEYAARGGKMSKGYKYSGSNEIEKVAWYGGSEGHTHPVGKKTPNELGIYDMSGNVWEWCSDWYGDYPATPQENPQGPLWGSDHVMRGFDHVMRGGGWHYGAGDCRVSDRGCDTSGDRDLVGFRLVSP